MTDRGLRHIVHVRVFVPAALWDASVKFYAETLELALSVRDDRHGYAIFEFPYGPTLGVEIDAPEPGEPPASGTFTAFSFLVDDVDRVYRDLVARGVRFVEPPDTRFWGGRLADFADPAGNVMTLVQYPKSRPAS